jgi:hypothetical protein
LFSNFIVFNLYEYELLLNSEGAKSEADVLVDFRSGDIEEESDNFEDFGLEVEEK